MRAIVGLRSTKIDGKAKYAGRWLYKDWQKIKLALPPHVICTSGGSHALDKNGANNLLFKFLCSGNWTIKSDSDWCKIAAEDARGSNTGVNERQVFFYVDPYDTESDTTHHTRRAKITITDTETGHIQTVDVVQSNR